MASAFVAYLRALNVTPHIAQHLNGRRPAIDGRTTRHAGYAVSQQKESQAVDTRCAIAASYMLAGL